jgi:exo-1,4-beta-D-glucosaminidase
MHAGAIDKTSFLANVQLALERRYGASGSVEEFVRKAQLAHYEDTRAQFEAFAAGDWANHKMTLYWMLNSHWPSFYGNIIDYYLSPGGTYFGAKKGLRPLSVVFDSYATGDHSQAKIIVFNQTPGDVQGLRVRIRVYDLDGKLRDDRSAGRDCRALQRAKQVAALPRFPASTPVFFVRCQLFDAQGKLLVENTYWQSQKDDDLGARKNDLAMDLRQDSWADMTALNTMPPVESGSPGSGEEDRKGEATSPSACTILLSTSHFSRGPRSPPRRMAVKSSPSSTTTITSPSFPAKQPRFTVNFRRAQRPAG